MFAGAKIALLIGEDLLTYRRSGDTPSYWGYIDLPGGGRAGDESAVECAIRELEEEIGLSLSPTDFHWHREFVGDPDHPDPLFIFAVTVPPDRLAGFSQGSEGEDWRFMPLKEFVEHPEVIPYLRRLVGAYLESSRS